MKVSQRDWKDTGQDSNPFAGGKRRNKREIATAREWMRISIGRQRGRTELDGEHSSAFQRGKSKGKGGGVSTGEGKGEGNCVQEYIYSKGKVSKKNAAEYSRARGDKI